MSKIEGLRLAREKRVQTFFKNKSRVFIYLIASAYQQ
jgi:hypothetical protein